MRRMRMGHEIQPCRATTRPSPKGTRRSVRGLSRFVLDHLDPDDLTSQYARGGGMLFALATVWMDPRLDLGLDLTPHASKPGLKVLDAFAQAEDDVNARDIDAEVAAEPANSREALNGRLVEEEPPARGSRLNKALPDTAPHNVWA